MFTKKGILKLGKAKSDGVFVIDSFLKDKYMTLCKENALSATIPAVVARMREALETGMLAGGCWDSQGNH